MEDKEMQTPFFRSKGRHTDIFSDTLFDAIILEFSAYRLDTSYTDGKERNP